MFVDSEGKNLRIIDFGTAQYYLKREKNIINSEKKELWSPSGTETYRSPEQICGKSNEKSIKSVPIPLKTKYQNQILTWE